MDKNIENEQKVSDLLQKYSDAFPHFDDGRINYSNTHEAPVITVFVEYMGEVLLLKRSDKVRAYQGKWNSVAGYLDRIEPIKERVFGELKEELGISKNMIKRVRVAPMYSFTDQAIQITWHICPVVAQLNTKPEIKLDWEHTDFAWIKPEQLKEYDTAPNLDKSLEYAFKMLKE